MHIKRHLRYRLPLVFPSANGGLEEALRQAPQDNLEISWQAFLLNPDMPLEGMDQTAYLAAKFGGEERSRRVYKAVADAGRSSGIAFAFDAISRAPNSNRFASAGAFRGQI